MPIENSHNSMSVLLVTLLTCAKCRIEYMNSKERHLRRYNRRKYFRELKRKEYAKKFDNIENVISLNKLHESAQLCSKGVMWKTSTQRYMYNEFQNITKARQSVLNHEDIRKGFICFDLFERGKLRHIKSVHIEERVIQKSLCKNVLTPLLKNYLIYDNGACIKGKGTNFALKRCMKHLTEFSHKNGNNGYVLVFDFKSFFESININKLLNMILKYLNDKYVIELTTNFLEAFGEYGLGLGSEICQISAVYYPSKIDHLIKDKFGFKYYGRYMDDAYIICNDKEKLKWLLIEIEKVCYELELKLSKNKTHIIKLSRGFTFLKTRFIITETSKILKLVWKKTIIREKRKIKSLFEPFKNGLITLEEIKNQVMSVIGTLKWKNAYKQRISIYNLFKEKYLCQTMNYEPIITQTA